MKNQATPKSLGSLNTFLFSEESEKKFYSFFKELQLYYGCTYMFFSYHDLLSGGKLVFQTDPEWNNIYIENNFIQDCPVIKHGAPILKCNPGKDIMLIWDLLIPQNEREKNVADARKDHSIFNGLSVVKEINGIRKMFGVATEKNNENFQRYVLSSSDKFKETVSLARQEADKVLSKFFAKNLESS